MQNFPSFKYVTSSVVWGTSMIAMAAALSVAVPMTFPEETGSVALAQEDGHGGGGGGHGGGGGGGGHSGGSGGHDDGGHDDGHDDGGHDDGHDDGGHEESEGHSGKGGPQGKRGEAAKGKGGPGADSEGKGPRAGRAGNSTGGKPVWAQEGIPDVELGRLNVARAPGRVLEKAMAEEVANLTDAEIAFYSLSLPEMIDKLTNDFDNVSRIDSPVANLGLLKDVMDGTSVLTSEGVVNDPEVLAAVFLGSASDKTVEITAETAYAVSVILGYELSEAQSEALAKDAEDVREAILEGHD